MAPPPEAAVIMHAPPSLSEEGPSSAGVGPQACHKKPKSARRRAAEAALHRRFSSSSLVSLADGLHPAPSSSSDEEGHAAKRRHTEQQPSTQQQQQQQQQRPAVHVAACTGSCGGGTAAAGAAADAAWCAQDVALPPMDWPSMQQPMKRLSGVSAGSWGQFCTLPGGVRTYLVCRPEHLPRALKDLRDSMQDGCVGIDLEWRPECYGGAGAHSRVALMQLASATVAVLIRVSMLGYRMPQPLRSFLRDPDLTFVGFSWDGCDEKKMQQTFGEGRSLFARFIDLQQVAEALGYHSIGLGALTQHVLGFRPHKSRKVTMSNWEARTLSPEQIQYAALDAVLTGHIYRGLRLWHASPSACTACRQPLGAVLPSPEWRCHDCNKVLCNSHAALSHRQQKQHFTTPDVCDECGRACAVTP